MKEIKMPYDEYEEMVLARKELAEILNNIEANDNLVIISRNNYREVPFVFATEKHAKDFLKNDLDHARYQIEDLEKRVQELTETLAARNVELNILKSKKKWWQL